MAYSRTTTARIIPFSPPRRSRSRKPLLPVSRLGLSLLVLLAVAVAQLLRPAAASAPAAAAAAARSPEIIQGAARVIDGDTLAIGAERIRLHGIDAPERGQTCDSAGRAWRCGRAATQALQERIGGRGVSCEALDLDRYGRHVARCTAGGEDLGSWMVALGHAIAYRRYSLAYVEQERRARLARIGVWSGEFTEPEIYRRS